MKTKTYTIWRESTGDFLLKEGTRQIHIGDVCVKLIEAPSWERAMAELHKFMDQKQKGMDGT